MAAAASSNLPGGDARNHMTGFKNGFVDKRICSDRCVVGDVNIPGNDCAIADIDMVPDHGVLIHITLVTNADPSMDHTILSNPCIGIHDDPACVPKLQALSEAVWTDLNPESLAQTVLFSFIIPKEIGMKSAPGRVVQVVFRFPEKDQISLQDPVIAGCDRINHFCLKAFRMIPGIVCRDILP